MSSANPRLEWLLAAVAVAICALAAVLVTAPPSRPAPAKAAPIAAPLPSPPPPTPVPTATVAFDLATVGAATTKVPTVVHSAPDPAAPGLSHLRPGILLPVWKHHGTFLRTMTPCELEGWVKTSDVELHTRTPGPPAALEDATIVLDPGHGGMQTGAVGPTGLPEKDANLAIAHKLIEHLDGPRVFLTRAFDFTAGLVYRTRIANALGAHALVSIHNNSAPDGPSDTPGSETWHQSRSPAAQRLSSLLFGELFEELKGFQISWVGDRLAGTRTRLNGHGHDYYGLLRGSTVPTVIVEAMYISNAPEEELLRRPEGQDAVARALARSLKRYVQDSGPDVAEPYAAAFGTTGGLPAGCVDPA